MEQIGKWTRMRRWLQTLNTVSSFRSRYELKEIDPLYQCPARLLLGVFVFFAGQQKQALSPVLNRGYGIRSGDHCLLGHAGSDAG